MTAGWSEARDAQLRRLRAEGVPWAAIGAALRVSEAVARERGRRIGARRGLDPQAAPPPADDPARDDPAREPLPAGHPRAWALLTDGTLLAGEDWPGYPANDIVGRPAVGHTAASLVAHTAASLVAHTAASLVEGRAA